MNEKPQKCTCMSKPHNSTCLTWNHLPFFSTGFKNAAKCTAVPASTGHAVTIKTPCVFVSAVLSCVFFTAPPYWAGFTVVADMEGVCWWCVNPWDVCAGRRGRREKKQTPVIGRKIQRENKKQTTLWEAKTKEKEKQLLLIGEQNTNRVYSWEESDKQTSLMERRFRVRLQSWGQTQPYFDYFTY